MTFAPATIRASITITPSPPTNIDIQPQSPGGVTLMFVTSAARPASVSGCSRTHVCGEQRHVGSRLGPTDARPKSADHVQPSLPSIREQARVAA